MLFCLHITSMSLFPHSASESKNDQQDSDTMLTSSLNVYRKFKRFRLMEPCVGILGFFLVMVCVLWCFFYLDYRAMAKGFGVTSEGSLWLNFNNGFVSGSGKRVELLSEEEGSGECDVFDGEWVWDESYPLYQSRDCRFLDEGFRCSENGRPDAFYTKWRWQPKTCNLPRFDAKLMLEKLQNKRLVFVGDSIGRNQWESLMCMLSSVVPNKDSIYEVRGSPITKHKGYLVFNFADYNSTVEYYRAPFLVLHSRPPPGTPEEVRTTLKLDKMDWSSSKWRDADVLVLNTGHWWNYQKTKRGGCYFQEGEKVMMHMKVDAAYRRSMDTVVDWISREVNTDKTQVFFRTYAPVHFRRGDWRNGGSCHMETLPELGSSLVPSHTWATYNIFFDVISARSNTSGVKTLDILNVTNMSSRRKDGHASLYYLGPEVGPASIRRQDCSHWCLPGVPDAWNELLFSLFLKKENARIRSSSAFHSEE